MTQHSLRTNRFQTFQNFFPTFNPLTLISPSLLCHRLELEALSTTATIFIHPSVVYKVPDFVSCATTIAPYTIFHELFELCFITCVVQLINRGQVLLEIINI